MGSHPFFPPNHVDPAPDVEQLWIPTSSAAKMLGLSRGQLLRRINEGSVPHEMVWRISDTNFRVYIGYARCPHRWKEMVDAQDLLVSNMAILHNLEQYVAKCLN